MVFRSRTLPEDIVKNAVTTIAPSEQDTTTRRHPEDLVTTTGPSEQDSAARIKHPDNLVTTTGSMEQDTAARKHPDYLVTITGPSEQDAATRRQRTRERYHLDFDPANCPSLGAGCATFVDKRHF